MKYFIDSNIFLRFLVKEDERTFRDCYRFLEKLKRKEVMAFTSSLVLSEVDWVLEGFYDFNKKDAVEALNSITRLRGLKIINNSDFSLALELYGKYSVKLIDALIASNPKILKKEITVVSYDKDFDKLGILRKEPGKIKA